MSASSHYHLETTLESDRQRTGDIYRKLAPIYDVIMKDVDYEDWTDYIHSLISYHHPHATDLLELACGTGTMALLLEQYDDYRITATDASSEMIQIARDKGNRSGSSITWCVRDMCRLRMEHSFDVIYMVFDSLNYLHKREEVLALFNRVQKHLKQDGRFIVDFTTPAYSPKIAPLLNEKQKVDQRYTYNRISKYDREKQIHINHFMIEKREPDTGVIVDRFEEFHTQRIWTFTEMKALVQESGLNMLAAYEDFDFTDATDNSDRITMILQHV